MIVSDVGLYTLRGGLAPGALVPGVGAAWDILDCDTWKSLKFSAKMGFRDSFVTVKSLPEEMDL